MAITSGSAGTSGGAGSTASAERPDAGSVGYPKKRARTRRSLLSAAQIVLAERGPDGATVGDIARRARVATGTFYNHFPSMADLVEAVCDDLAAAMEIEADVLAAIEHDPAVRVAIGTRQLLRLVADDPTAAQAFVSLQASIPAFRRRVRRLVVGAVGDGVADGRFRPLDVDTLGDALLGAVVQWMRSDLVGDTEPASPDDRVSLALSMLGLGPDEITATLDDAVARMAGASAA